MDGANPPTDQGVSDQQRHTLEAALVAALLLLYAGHRTEALTRLGALERDGELSPAVRMKITSFAARRAQLIQDGTNQRIANAAPDDATAAETQAAQATAASEAQDHNMSVLVPFMASTVAHWALIDTYRQTPDPNGSGASALDATQWVWQRNTDAPADDCQEANDASPATYDQLMSIAGSPPPVHENCQCDLTPA